MDATDDPEAVFRTIRSVVVGSSSSRRAGRPSRGESRQDRTARSDARDVAEQARHTLEEIDYPAFVADLIRGTFDAQVAVSIEQIEAYGDLLDEVTEALDDYLSDDATEEADNPRSSTSASGCSRRWSSWGSTGSWSPTAGSGRSRTTTELLRRPRDARPPRLGWRPPPSADLDCIGWRTWSTLRSAGRSGGSRRTC